ncbi:MAG: glycine dehydrogenase (aminomethyl-transferring), partial [Okeania sp. SIO2D1]|nr:glycine dehydrogenase (aminomethyl-transferring) [Okeania sp. SIO2D1]
MLNLDASVEKKINQALVVLNHQHNLSSSEIVSTVESFMPRHIGPDQHRIEQMLQYLGVSDLEELIEKTVPSTIRLQKPLELPEAKTEYAALAQLKVIASQNEVLRSLLGMGYHDCLTPPVIGRNILENPGWYTAYTPYQAEISQGRLAALLNFQTMIIDLTGLEIANASLLDEGTAAAEAMTMSYGLCKTKAQAFFVS